MGQLKQCCFCLPLSTGTVVIGVLDLIGSVIYVVVYSLSEPPTSKGIRPWWNEFFIFLLVYCILRIVFDCLLIYAAIRFKAEFIVPWMVSSIAGLTLILIGVVALSVMLLASLATNLFVQMIIIPYVIALIVFLAAFAFAIYLIRVVFSFYKSIKNLS